VTNDRNPPPPQRPAASAAPAPKDPTHRHWRQLVRRKNKHMVFAEDIGPVGSKMDIEIIMSGGIKVKGQDGKEDEMPYLQPAKHVLGGKQLGLNVTNCQTMETITGTADYMLWRGWITLVVIRTDKPTKTGRVETDAIRIAPRRPNRDPSAGISPFVARFEACATPEEFKVVDTDMRAGWEAIPAGQRDEVKLTARRVSARIKAEIERQAAEAADTARHAVQIAAGQPPTDADGNPIIDDEERAEIERNERQRAEREDAP
jgi:hypothetical protein